MNNQIRHFIPGIIMGITMLFFAVFLSGCYQGRPSEKPPIHVNPNMDKQEKYTVQSESQFFADNSSMRTPVTGTVSRGNLKEDTVYFQGKTGKDKDGNDLFVHPSPVTLDMKLLKRGQERYNIYCSVCHGKTGEGNGIVVQRGLLPPPTFHDDRLRTKQDGYLFDVITNGKGNMPSYKHQAGVEDRWAIVAYLRALQRSRNASSQDVPEINRNSLQ